MTLSFALIADVDRSRLEAFVGARFAAQPEVCQRAGFAIAVVQGDAPLLVRGYGYADADAKIAVDPEKTLFRIASVTKPMTALAVLQLAESRALELDEEVEHLLTHTAALDHSWIGCGARSAEAIDISGHVELHPRSRFMPPGIVASYNSHHYVVAGGLVEAASKHPYQDYMRERIFHPA